MPAPMIDDIELRAVQAIRQETRQDFVPQPVVGLEGMPQQRLGRRSHRILLSGCLLPDKAAEDLAALQAKAASGEEVTFTADITTALEIAKMVIVSFTAEQQIGPSGQIAYAIELVENPPLPPPAEVSAFGGLGDFGLGDIGFDDLGGVLDTIAEQAGAVMEAVDSALDAVEQLSALADLADLGNITNPLRPVTERIADLGKIGPSVQALGAAIRGLTGGGG